MAPPYSPPVPEGFPRLLSQAASFACLFGTLIAARLTGGLWPIGGLLMTGAFWSNGYRLPVAVRTLCVVAEFASVAGAVALLVTVPFIAESGRDAPLWRSVAVCVCLAIVSLVLSASVSAARTLLQKRPPGRYL